jgi:hypothetical protein
MDKVLFSGPWVKDSGMLPRRVVLHARVEKGRGVDEYVVHEQGFMPKSQGFSKDQFSYGDGD